MIRIGEVAERTGLTPRTIRYYEEIGLLPGPAARRKGEHRAYDDSDVERLSELTRLRDLLNLSLEELKQLDPFIANMHMALWVLTGVSLLGAAVSLLRPAHVTGDVTLDEIFEAEAA